MNIKNKKLRVLVACEVSGVVRDAFAERGFDAWSCDTQESDRAGQHYWDDARKILNQQWDLMIGHPPCTFTSNAGAKHLYPKRVLNQRRFQLGINAKQFFLDLLNAPIRFIALENPIPSTIFSFPKYTQIIQPYQFGHPFQKKTCLWLKNLPTLKPTKIMENPENTRLAGNWFNKGGIERQKNRSQTFEGIAAAMAKQWGTYLLEQSEYED